MYEIPDAANLVEIYVWNCTPKLNTVYANLKYAGHSIQEVQQLSKLSLKFGVKDSLSHRTV